MAVVRPARMSVKRAHEFRASGGELNYAPRPTLVFGRKESP